MSDWLSLCSGIHWVGNQEIQHGGFYKWDSSLLEMIWKYKDHFSWAFVINNVYDQKPHAGKTFIQDLQNL